MPAKYSVQITPTAEADIEDIWSYIAEDSPAAAEAFILALEKCADTLKMCPERCPLVPENELLGTRYRHLLHGNYRIIYRISGNTVFVLRVIHGARLLEII
jgi:plasmid stabilization system protein ParE